MSSLSNSYTYSPDHPLAKAAAMAAELFDNTPPPFLAIIDSLREESERAPDAFLAGFLCCVADGVIAREEFTTKIMVAVSAEELGRRYRLGILHPAIVAGSAEMAQFLESQETKSTLEVYMDSLSSRALSSVGKTLH